MSQTLDKLHSAIVLPALFQRQVLEGQNLLLERYNKLVLLLARNLLMVHHVADLGELLEHEVLSGLELLNLHVLELQLVLQFTDLLPLCGRHILEVRVLLHIVCEVLQMSILRLNVGIRPIELSLEIFKTFFQLLILLSQPSDLREGVFSSWTLRLGLRCALLGRCSLLLRVFLDQPLLVFELLVSHLKLQLGLEVQLPHARQLIQLCLQPCHLLLVHSPRLLTSEVLDRLERFSTLFDNLLHHLHAVPHQQALVARRPEGPGEHVVADFSAFAEVLDAHPGLRLHLHVLFHIIRMEFLHQGRGKA
mmetsp:Transcript_23642/g.76961  ORF Transcript_23642/g.76961 Transcript_23642/m.76961 type:complete len:306 (+) Transcript_23642:400-1317(+)